jgi:hypothetical protein
MSTVESMSEIFRVSSSAAVPDSNNLEVETRLAAIQFVEVWEAAYQDPLTVRKERVTYRTGTIQHRYLPGVELWMAQTIGVREVGLKKPRTLKVVKDAREMVVREPGGEGMSFLIDLHDKDLQNLAEDPFAELIIDYFRQHLETK